MLSAASAGSSLNRTGRSNSGETTLSLVHRTQQTLLFRPVLSTSPETCETWHPPPPHPQCSQIVSLPVNLLIRLYSSVHPSLFPVSLLPSKAFYLSTLHAWQSYNESPAHTPKYCSFLCTTLLCSINRARCIYCISILMLSSISIYVIIFPTII